ncbi:MAG: DUF4925 domain-containing protein [Alistipes sp.]|nr:DUF4925 domain-containing protein [Alistipes sp.]
MKRTRLSRLLWLLAAIPLFFACESAPYYGEGIDSEFNKLYSNKTSKDHVTADLSLTYNGYQFLGREVYFNLMTKETARIKFFAVFPGEAETVIENVRVAKPANGYYISGSYMTPAGTSFVLEGSVTATDRLPSMQLTVDGVAIAPNILSQKGKFKTFETESTVEMGTEYIFVYNNHFNLLWNWNVLANGQEETLLGDLNDMVWSILSNLLYLALDEINFHPDGEITATYCRFEGFDLTSLMDTATDADRGPKETSPKGLLSYNVTSGNIVKIRPNMEMILDLVATNQGRTRTDDDSGGLDIAGLLPLILNILNLYPEIITVFEEGLGFVLDVNDPDDTFPFYLDPTFGNKYYGDYKFYMDSNLLNKGILNSLTGLVSPILDLLGLDLSDLDIPALGGMGIDLGAMLDEIIERIENTTEVQLGLYLEAAN